MSEDDLLYEQLSVQLRRVEVTMLPDLRAHYGMLRPCLVVRYTVPYYTVQRSFLHAACALAGERYIDNVHNGQVYSPLGLTGAKATELMCSKQRGHTFTGRGQCMAAGSGAS